MKYPFVNVYLSVFLFLLPEIFQMTGGDEDSKIKICSLTNASLTDLTSVTSRISNEPRKSGYIVISRLMSVETGSNETDGDNDIKLLANISYAHVSLNFFLFCSIQTNFENLKNLCNITLQGNCSQGANSFILSITCSKAVNIAGNCSKSLTPTQCETDCLNANVMDWCVSPTSINTTEGTTPTPQPEQSTNRTEQNKKSSRDQKLNYGLISIPITLLFMGIIVIVMVYYRKPDALFRHLPGRGRNINRDKKKPKNDLKNQKLEDTDEGVQCLVGQANTLTASRSEEERDTDLTEYTMPYTDDQMQASKSKPRLNYISVEINPGCKEAQTSCGDTAHRTHPTVEYTSIDAVATLKLAQAQRAGEVVENMVEDDDLYGNSRALASEAMSHHAAQDASRQESVDSASHRQKGADRSPNDKAQSTDNLIPPINIFEL